MRNADYYRSRITALEDDIMQYGATEEDLEHLAEYKKELRGIEERTANEKV